MTRRFPVGDEVLHLPDDWKPSLFVSAPAPKGVFVPNLVLSRERMRVDESFSTYLARQLVQFAKNLRQFKLHSRRDLEVQGHPAHFISCGWTGDQGPIEQRITLIPLDGVVINFTASMAKASAPEMEPLFESVVASAEL